MTDILQQIVANKRREVAAKSALGLYREVEEGVTRAARAPLSMSRRLAESPTGIIAEFKRRSPSKGELHPMAMAGTVVSGYERAGAAACSVLTDTAYFGGSLDDLAAARESSSLPLLRKEFVVDERQILEARCYGADAVLLIASVLTAKEVERFAQTAHSVGLEVLLELHGAGELDKVAEGVDMVGVNNRNLATFMVDIEESLSMAAMLPADIVKVAESGLTSMEQVSELRAAGYQGFLMGERFMRYADPASALNDFINGVKQ